MTSCFKEDYLSNFMFFRKYHVREDTVFYRTKADVADLLGFEYDCILTFNRGMYEVQIEKWIGGYISEIDEKN